MVDPNDPALRALGAVGAAATMIFGSVLGGSLLFQSVL